MKIKTNDILILQGSTFRSSCHLVDFDETTGVETPIDLTGYAGRGQIRWKSTDPLPLAEFVVSLTNPTNGDFDFVLPAESSSAIVLTGAGADDLSIAYYDIELYKNDEVIRVVSGKAYISPEQTK